MPRVEVLREKVLLARKRIRLARRELGAAMREDNRSTAALKAALERRAARVIDDELEVRR